MESGPVVTCVLEESTRRRLFDERMLGALRALAGEVTVLADFTGADDVLARTEVLVTGWGTPLVDAAVVDRMPRLRAVLHSAGTVRGIVDDVVHERGILVSTQAEANAIPVAEFTLAVVLLANKGVLVPATTPYPGYDETRQGAGVGSHGTVAGVGNYGKRVGVVGASRTGRRVVEALRRHDLEVVVYDPYLSPAAADLLGVAPLGLDELVATSDVVTVHAPATPETYHQLDARRLATLRDGAVLVNTSRGSLVDTAALEAELARRADDGRGLTVVLDVTEPDPLPPTSPLLSDPRVLVTPHVAGSKGTELRRLAQGVVDELARLVSGVPLAHRVDHATLARSA
ncbi:hydroxyacid dehydrogenase [Xylanimonas protaetiae]|uniref:Hydroxyacid dehydrogenase n=1 Tax=Xylanimonas protaetiae TaxID=2509457 RepID=A0A4P6F6C6_9MICO|nr:hydroxyacid dehydrogenase [Xylanimonas protaetiae]QAY71194.1 hydroxyacid dehydrogenase [Xylanimonas protaetiae]